MTTALFLLRCVKGNDGVKYDRMASQEDFDKF